MNIPSGLNNAIRRSGFARKHFRQNCGAVLRPEMLEDKEMERFRDSEKSGSDPEQRYEG
ncbi:protein of unknown function [Shinella sp. WSC3-e]|nr:protein of unknown function [Shinella sp. WSC3-e]